MEWAFEGEPNRPDHNRIITIESCIESDGRQDGEGTPLANLMYDHHKITLIVQNERMRQINASSRVAPQEYIHSCPSILHGTRVFLLQLS